jgi:hypothetical protein
MKRLAIFLAFLSLSVPVLKGIESGQYRLLSAPAAQKWILISSTPGKPKYILDAATAKITVDGKPAEFKDLARYSVINVKFELKKSSKYGIEIDGVASEIRVLTPEQPKKLDPWPSD